MDFAPNNPRDIFEALVSASNGLLQTATLFSTVAEQYFRDNGGEDGAEPMEEEDETAPPDSNAIKRAATTRFCHHLGVTKKTAQRGFKAFAFCSTENFSSVWMDHNNIPLNVSQFIDENISVDDDILRKGSLWASDEIDDLVSYVGGPIASAFREVRVWAEAVKSCTAGRLMEELLGAGDDVLAVFSAGLASEETTLCHQAAKMALRHFCEKARLDFVSDTPKDVARNVLSFLAELPLPAAIRKKRPDPYTPLSPLVDMVLPKGLSTTMDGDMTNSRPRLAVRVWEKTEGFSSKRIASIMDDAMHGSGPISAKTLGKETLNLLQRGPLTKRVWNSLSDETLLSIRTTAHYAGCKLPLKIKQGTTAFRQRAIRRKKGVAVSPILAVSMKKKHFERYYKSRAIFPRFIAEKDKKPLQIATVDIYVGKRICGARSLKYVAEELRLREKRR